jgi:hypothetical protein
MRYIRKGIETSGKIAQKLPHSLRRFLMRHECNICA